MCNVQYAKVSLCTVTGGTVTSLHFDIASPPHRHRVRPHTLLVPGGAAAALGPRRGSLKLPALLEGKLTASAGSCGPRAREPNGDKFASTVAGSALIAAARASSSRRLLRLMMNMASTARRARMTMTATAAPAITAMLEPLPLLPPLGVLGCVGGLPELGLGLGLGLLGPGLGEPPTGGDSFVAGEADAAGRKQGSRRGMWGGPAGCVWAQPASRASEVRATGGAGGPTPSSKHVCSKLPMSAHVSRPAQPARPCSCCCGQCRRSRWRAKRAGARTAPGCLRSSCEQPSKAGSAVS